tara:strand:+ start:1117 stop:1509 length:393 start_codon:yes stop_codon:yes gene_type:complete
MFKVISWDIVFSVACAVQFMAAFVLFEDYLYVLLAIILWFILIQNYVSYKRSSKAHINNYGIVILFTFMTFVWMVFITYTMMSALTFFKVEWWAILVVGFFVIGLYISTTSVISTFYGEKSEVKLEEQAS